MIFFFRITRSANVNWCLWFITSSTGNRLKQSIQFLECKRLYSDFKYPVEVYSISVHNVHPLLNKRVNINRKKLNSWYIFIDKAHRSPSTWEGFEGCRERTRNERRWCLVHVDLTQLVINLWRGAFKKTMNFNLHLLKIVPKWSQVQPRNLSEQHTFPSPLSKVLT